MYTDTVSIYIKYLWHPGGGLPGVDFRSGKNVQAGLLGGFTAALTGQSNGTVVADLSIQAPAVGRNLSLSEALNAAFRAPEKYAMNRGATSMPVTLELSAASSDPVPEER